MTVASGNLNGASADVRAQHAKTNGHAVPSPLEVDPETQADPDLGVLRLHRREPPGLALEVFGQNWGRWLEEAARGASCPVDYVAMPLLAASSALIGNARWAQATRQWQEPPHLWCGVVGDSGSGKSPGADAVQQLVAEMDRRMARGFDEVHREWRLGSEAAKARLEAWERDVRRAQKSGDAGPAMPRVVVPPEPQMPRLRANDVTVEKVAALLAGAASKGLLMVRDELSGWLLGMSAYSDAARPFWLEAYGGRPYIVDRVKHPEPIHVPRLAVGWFGGIQPERLAQAMREADDGLLARFCLSWPNPVRFSLDRHSPDQLWAIEAFERLRLLEMQRAPEPDAQPTPVMVPLAEAAKPLLEELANELLRRQEFTSGLMRSALGKARGLALRLSLVLECLWWCGGDDGMAAPPREISVAAFTSAARLVSDYFIPMAERVYGDAAAPKADRDAATLARWIARDRPSEVHVRRLQREIRLPGLRDAESIHGAARVLVEAGWLTPPPKGNGTGRPRANYTVNPRLLEQLP
jgi:Protein of unknown function (DUF3987)